MRTLYVAVATALVLAWPVLWSVRYIRANPHRRLAMRMAVRVRFGWLRLSQLLDLYVKDTTPHFAHIRRLIKPRQYRFPIQKSRVKAPRLRIKSDDFGVIVSASTLPGVGLDEWQKNADHLANAWGAVRVTVGQERPGRIRVRAVHRDPLRESTTWEPAGEEPTELDWSSWFVGRDEYAQDARLPIKNVPAMTLAGLPGSGKTSLVGGLLLARYGVSRRVALVLADGKGGGDYSDWAPRAARYVEDDQEAARDLFRSLEELRLARQKRITLAPELGGLGTRNFWNVGPTEAWPLVVTIIDESHTFLEEVRVSRGDKESEKLAAITAENRRTLANLVKKQRSVGMFTLFATQKATADAIPTAIRDVCPLLASFAQTTSAAAVAALGEDIRNFPGASPVDLQGPEYVGCLVTKVQGMPGFTRVRSPFVPELAQERIAREVAGMRVDPWELLRSVPVSGISVAQEVND